MGVNLFFPSSRILPVSLLEQGQIPIPPPEGKFQGCSQRGI